MLRRLDEDNLQVHPGKSAIEQPRVQYLVLVLSEKGNSASSDKFKAVRQHPNSKNVKDQSVYRPSFVLQRTSALFR